MSGRVELDVTPSERTAIVTLALARGETLTPADVMRLTECRLSTAYEVLNRLARVLPLYQDSGKWALLESLHLNID